MINRLTRAVLGSTRQAASQTGAWAVIVRDTVSGFRTTAHHALMFAGITALGALGIMFVKPDLADHLKALSPFSTEAAQQQSVAVPQLANFMEVSPKPVATTADISQAAVAPKAIPAQTAKPMSEEENKLVGTSRQQQWVTNWLSKRYRVAGDATNMLVSSAYLTAKEIKLDPLLILAVMAIESRFNPFAESPVGAQGLMQVMSKLHHEKFQDLGGVKAALNPVANIKVGSLILKDYVKRGGSVEAGLKLYVGAADSETDSGYGAKVLAEYRRLKDVAMGKKVPAFSTAARVQQKRPERATDEKSEALTEAETASGEQPV
jgi:hypothetical protein